MKLIFVLLFASVAFADSFNIDFHFPSPPFSFSKKSFIENEELNMGFFVTCLPEHKGVCQTLCGQISCLVSRDSCNSCISSSNLNIFAIFRDFNKWFVLSEGNVDWVHFIDRLLADEWHVIDENSILNLFDDTQSDEKYNDVRNRFLQSCPPNTSKAFMIVDQNTVPQLYICQGSFGQTIFQTQLAVQK